MITTFIGGRRQIAFDDFRRTKSFKRLLSGLKALEADMRCWTQDNLVNDSYVVYARSLVEEALSGPYVDWGGTDVDERVRRMKWTTDEVVDLVYDLADNSYVELVSLDMNTGRAIACAIDCMLDSKHMGRKR